MRLPVSFVLFLALVWGGIWALFLQVVPLGQFLARRRTYITVVVGVGVDLALAFFCVPFGVWWKVVAIIALSSLPIILRSWVNDADGGERITPSFAHRIGSIIPPTSYPPDL